MAKEINLPSKDQIKGYINKLLNKVTRRHQEINLVPDIKNEAIKSIKLRNATFFLSIVIVAVSLGFIAVFSSIAGGQQAIVGSKQNDIETLSNKIKSYKDLDNFLTIKDQLGGLSKISENKTVLSRVFNVLTALLPKGNNTIKISELSINLQESPVVISFDAQANAGEPPYYDYLVLDSFQKSMQYMRYYYGRYVDKEGNEIPAYCIIESGIDGANFQDQDKGIYAYWLITGEGCNPSYEAEYDEDGTVTNSDSVTSGYESEVEEYEGQTVVKIWRTPQFSDWYSEEPAEYAPYMSESGTIENVAHFDSSCITYSAIENYQATGNPSETSYTTDGSLTWVGTNQCELVDLSVNNGISVPANSNSNGRGADGELVLRFSASIYLEPEVFSFENKHLLALGPSSRYNVTDSFVQIKEMFAPAASECADDDIACKNNQTRGEN